MSELVFCLSSELDLKSDSAGSSIILTRFWIFSISCGKYELESLSTLAAELYTEEARGAAALLCTPYKDLMLDTISDCLFLESTLLVSCLPRPVCILYK